MEERIEELESRQAFMEMNIEQLSQTVYEQHKLIDTLRAQVKRLEEKSKSAEESGGSFLHDEPPPPHY
ncbi:SlyX family protein [Spirochaeta dissipatitropha]